MTLRRSLLAAGVLFLVGLLSLAMWLGGRLSAPGLPAAGPSPAPAAGEVARGEYLAQAGHCAGCHTARGGAAWAGGRPISTPFGVVHSANLTPDTATGLGGWSLAAFNRALRQGRSADGRLLVPACPYPNFSAVSDDDARDLFAYLRSVPAVRQSARPHELRFPYGTQLALAAWQGLYFHPAAGHAAHDDAGRTAAWRRGAYLVGTLGHCSACHGQRNAWGATEGPLDLRGGALAQQGWWAPALDSPQEAGVADWPLDQIVALLKTGRSERASVAGPMAMVVKDSTQHLSDADLLAIATYLQSLPQRAGAAAAQALELPAAEQALGAKVYEQHCAACHGAAGEGRTAPAHMPALAGNRAVMMEPAVNLMRVVLGGAYGPSTRAEPQPVGMPPFATVLSDTEVAAVLNHVRRLGGRAARPVTAREVNAHRGSGS